MNKALLTVNIILIVALGYLYYAFYSAPKAVTQQEKINDTTGTHFKIAYFDLDTLEKSYDYAKETRDYLSGKNDAVESKLNQLKATYSNKLNDYQKRGASMSQTEQSQMQEDLGRMQQNFEQEQQSLGQQFQNEYMQKMLDLKKKIQDYLKNYCVQKGYEFVFAASSDDNVIYYKDSIRNITTELVNNLNQDYRNSKKK